MKAMVCTQYGSPDVLRLEDVKKPVPQGKEVLVKVCASSVNAGDWHILRADPFLMRLAFGILKPKVKILGADIAGRVEAVGESASRFVPGDAVFGNLSACGFGGFAEFACVPEEFLVRMPGNLSFEEAAAVPAAGVTALQGLRDKGKIQPGQNVLIVGASGGVGTFAVQLARYFGAEVTAVCSTKNLEIARSLGANQVIDYTAEDFTRNGQNYDLIVAVNGYRSILDYERALSPGGTYVLSGGTTRQFFEALLLGPLLSSAKSKSMGNLLVQPNGEDVRFLAGLLESEAIRPVIDRQYPFEQVPDAMRYLEEGHARGKVVITFGHKDRT